MGITEVLSLATLLATIIMLVYAVFAFWKEVKVERLEENMKRLEKRIETGILQIEQNRIVEEICHSYIREASGSNVYDYQKLKRHLETILYVDDEELARKSLKLVLMMTNPLYNHSYESIRSLLITLWMNDHFGKRGMDLDHEFNVDFEHCFGDALPIKHLLPKPPTPYI